MDANATIRRILAGATLAALAGASACSGSTSTPDPGPGAGAGDGAGDDGGGAGDDGADDGADDGGDDGGNADCAAQGTPFDVAALAETVALLASDELAGRAPGSPGDQAARRHIEERFRCLGLTPAGADGSYQQPFVTSAGEATANVVGFVPGGDPAVASQAILVGAHHDHLGSSGADIYRGANDNASGVAAMLAMAHALQQRGEPPRRTVVFVAFGFEEHDGDCEGSELYVDSPPGALPIDQVVYMVDADMVGVYPLEESLTAYGSFPGTPGRAALDQLAGQHPGLQLDLGAAAGEDDSDFQAFCDLGIPYIYFETWDEPCWHEPCDTADRIDYPSMSEIATLSFELVLALADSEEDLAAARQDGPCRSPGPARVRRPHRHRE